jgi:hypothetical protein
VAGRPARTESEKIAGRPLVVLRGGRRDGWWYFAKDIDQQKRACESIAGRQFDYEPSMANGRPVMIKHPTIENESGQVWTYREARR